MNLVVSGGGHADRAGLDASHFLYQKASPALIRPKKTHVWSSAKLVSLESFWNAQPVVIGLE